MYLQSKARVMTKFTANYQGYYPCLSDRMVTSSSASCATSFRKQNVLLQTLHLESKQYLMKITCDTLM